jgi:hypothetical protein
MPSTDTWTSQLGESNLVGVGRERSWNNTPNWWTIPKEDLPVNGYDDRQKTRRSIAFDTSVVEKTGGTEIGSFNRHLTGNQTVSFCTLRRATSKVSFDEKMVAALNKAKVGALVKMADAKVNLAVAYAEAHKTSSLILDTARRIDRAYRALRKGNLKGVAKELNITPTKVHKTWLEYKYGWMPLLMDVRGSAEFFAQQAITRKPRFTVSRKIQDSYQEVGDVDHGAPFGVPPSVSSTLTHVFKGEVKAHIWCELSSPHYSELQQLGLTNPALVAWELVPFSFVFDWFIQVGDYLTALSAFHGVRVLRAYTSQVTNATSIFNYPQVTREDAGYVYAQTPLECWYVERQYTREPWFPSPLELSIPVTNNFDFPKLVTSLALIRGGYRGTARV